MQPLCGKFKVGDVLSCRVDSVNYELKTCVVNENDDIIAYVERDVAVGLEDFVSVTVTKIEQDESSEHAEVSIKYKTI